MKVSAEGRVASGLCKDTVPTLLPEVSEAPSSKMIDHLRKRARTLLARIARSPLALAVARRVFPPWIKHKIARIDALLVGKPTVSDMKELLSELRQTEPVAGRVVIVCGSLQPGGAERQVVNTLVGLQGAGLESVTLLCDDLHPAENNKYDFYLPIAKNSSAEVRVVRSEWDKRSLSVLPKGIRNPSPALRPEFIADVTKLFLEFQALRPETVHAWLDWSNVRAGLAAVLAGVPNIILSGRNLSPRHFALNTDYFLPAYKAILEKGNGRVRLINNSEAGAKDYAAWLSISPKEIGVVRNGVHFTENRQAVAEQSRSLRAHYGIPVGARVIGGMYRFALEKRPILWLEAASHVVACSPETHLMLFGEGEMREAILQKAKELGLESRLHLCGVASPSGPALAACDVVLLTSFVEGTPNVLLEAQWLGVPVVTTDAGGAGEAVSHASTGFVVTSDNSDEIANAVLRILRDPEFSRVARERGPTFIQERYGLHRMIQETLDLYRLTREAGVT